MTKREFIELFDSDSGLYYWDDSDPSQAEEIQKYIDTTKIDEDGDFCIKIEEEISLTIPETVTVTHIERINHNTYISFKVKKKADFQGKTIA